MQRELGLAGEKMVAGFLQSRGAGVVASYDFSGSDGDKAPRMMFQAYGRIIPDLDVSRGGERFGSRSRRTGTRRRTGGSDSRCTGSGEGIGRTTSTCRSSRGQRSCWRSWRCSRDSSSSVGSTRCASTTANAGRASEGPCRITTSTSDGTTSRSGTNSPSLRWPACVRSSAGSVPHDHRRHMAGRGAGAAAGAAAPACAAPTSARAPLPGARREAAAVHAPACGAVV